MTPLHSRSESPGAHEEGKETRYKTICTSEGPADSRDSVKCLVQLQNKFQEMTKVHNVEYFYETRAYKILKSWLEAGKSAIIAGHPGSGKSATCVKLYDSFNMRKGYNCTVSCNNFDPTSFNQQCYNIIFLDDVFNVRNKRDDFEGFCKKIVDLIQAGSAVSQSLLIVITIDSATLELHRDKFENIPFISNLIDLTTVEYAAQSDEKRGILEKHLQRRNITIVELPERENLKPSKNSAIEVALSKKTINEIVKVSDSMVDYECGFPLACDLFCRSKTLLKWKSNFFNKPLTKVKRHIEKMRQSSDPALTLQYLIYVYTVLMGEIRPHCLDHKVIEMLRKEVIPLFSQGTGPGEDLTDIRTDKWINACDTSSYLAEYNQVQYKFVHECVFLVVLCDFGTWQNGLLYKLCDNEGTLRMYEKAYYVPKNPEQNILCNFKAWEDTSSLAKNLRSASDGVHLPLTFKQRENNSNVMEEDELIHPLMLDTSDPNDKDSDVE